MENREIEAKFLEINKDELISKLESLGARDEGEVFLRILIFYDAAGKWVKHGKTFVRIRETKRGTAMAYKNDTDGTVTGTEEIEFGIDNLEKAKLFLEKVGLIFVRELEKKRHTFKLGEVIVDIDTWPKVPTLVELEGPSEDALRQAAALLGFDWQKAVFGNSMIAIEKHYGIPVRKLRFFTFDKVE